ncbi:MAG: GNAT family N-acetyltransferase [Putridiphycobacter sp.]|nr:GNAT family N-acetyltransferase [Putridiphycobacter sp.]
MRELIHDRENQRYVLPLEDGFEAVVNYTIENGIMRLVYSSVPPQLRGRKIGRTLVEKTFEKLTEEGYKAEAICSYIRTVAKRSNKWKNIIH